MFCLSQLHRLYQYGKVTRKLNTLRTNLYSNLVEMSSQSPSFKILRPAASPDSLQRLGLFSRQGRNVIKTPSLLAISSRGFIPHITTDILSTETSISAVHAGLEDYSPLRKFVTLPNDPLLVLGPRRVHPVISNGPNTYTSLNVCTSIGHRELEISLYLEAISKSRPDVVIAPIDIEFGRLTPGMKRRDKMVERSTAWLRSFQISMKEVDPTTQARPEAWIPILPIDKEVQRSYLRHLEESEPESVDGIVIYDPSSIAHIPKPFQDKVLVALNDPKTPHAVLRLVGLGVDLIAATFITSASEAGIALDFCFPARKADKILPLGTDMWPEDHAVDLGPLSKNCTCYACQHHHRAYLRHLLSVKEMLAWTLLQIHNHHVVANFFSGIRKSIAQGTFEKEAEEFTTTYQSELPAFQGQGPRLRGYQASFGAKPKKLNQQPFRKMGQDSSTRGKGTNTVLNERREKKLESEEANVLSPGVDAAILENLGFGNLYGGGS